MNSVKQEIIEARKGQMFKMISFNGVRMLYQHIDEATGKKAFVAFKAKYGQWADVGTLLSEMLIEELLASDKIIEIVYKEV